LDAQVEDAKPKTLGALMHENSLHDEGHRSLGQHTPLFGSVIHTVRCIVPASLDIVVNASRLIIPLFFLVYNEKQRAPINSSRI